MVDLFLLVLISTVETHVGVPVEIDYRLPAAWQISPIDSGEQWEVVSQDSGVITIIPLDLDTLLLPDLVAWNSQADSILLEPPVVVIARSMPDTLYDPAVFPSPAFLEIPQGFPDDYLNALRFWLVWGGPPGPNWLLYGILAAAVTAAAFAVWFVLRKRRRTSDLQDSGIGTVAVKSFSAEALELLESRWFVEGRWLELYTDVDRLFRNTIERKFGVVNRALTYSQVNRKLKSEPKGKRFIRETGPLMEEISLQRYAGWGSTRDRASRFIRLLGKIMET